MLFVILFTGLLLAGFITLQVLADHACQTQSQLGVPSNSDMRDFTRIYECARGGTKTTLIAFIILIIYAVS